jgi:DNA primase
MDRFEETKLRIKEANDLVAWVESYLPLRPRGNTLVALCPFHAEKTPSFTIYRDSQHFHCFGCGKSGDVFSFLMEREGLSFREAMERLAERAGISLDGVFGRGEANKPKGPDAAAVLAELRAFFQAVLQSGEGQLARQYLADRGLTAAIEPWGLGCCPAASGEVARFAERRRLPMQVLEHSGLLRASFQGRLLFPIEDERGRTVAFGARIVPGSVSAQKQGDFEPPKYVNSPESPFFSKRRLLFGLHRTKQAGNRRIIVMEGYTDVIASHLAGFTGAVATLGTAFTGDHARMVERYATEGLVLLFDGDRAGLQAAERASRELVNSRLPVRIALMSGAKDPGDFLVPRAGEAEAELAARRAEFAVMLEAAADWLTVWFRLLRKRLDFSQAVHLEAAGRECAALLAAVDGDLRREALLQEMARHLGTSVQSLQRMVKARLDKAPAATAAAGNPSARAPGPQTPTTPAHRAEADLLACVIADPSLAAQVLTTQAVDGPFADTAVAELVAMAKDGALVGRAAADDLLRYLFARCAEREDLNQLLALAAARARSIPEPAAFCASLQAGRRRLHGRGTVRALRQQLHEAVQAGDQAMIDELTKQLVAELRQGHLPQGAPGASTSSSTSGSTSAST